MIDVSGVLISWDTFVIRSVLRRSFFDALFYRPVQSISDLIDADCCFKLSAFRVHLTESDNQPDRLRLLLPL